MRVLIAFYSGDRNPYLRLLVESLREAGITVDTAKSGTVMPLLRAARRSGKPDLVHLQWPIYFSSDRTYAHAIIHTLQFFFQVMVMRMWGVAFVWTIHNISNHEHYQLRWERWACRRLARLVDALIVHCDAAVPMVAEAYDSAPAKIHVVPHGNYISWYPAAVAQAAARRAVGLPAAGQIYLYFGRIREYKGVRRLVEAFGAFPADDVSLVLVGKTFSAATKEWLENTQREDPRIHTEAQFIEDERLVQYICAADFVVLPYENALTSGAAILAFSLGRPVLATNVGCMQELPTEGAILFAPGDNQALIEAFNQAHAADSAWMGQKAQEYIHQFSWSTIAGLNLAIYHQVLDSAPVRRHD